MSARPDPPPISDGTPIRLVGEQVVLREKRLDDGDDDFDWRSDPELATFDAVPALRMSRADFKRILERDLGHPYPRQLNLSIEAIRTGDHIGNCMFYDYNEYRAEAELGIMIGRKDYWGQGYGTEAITLFTDYLFSERGLKRIYLHTLKWNVRAQKSFMKVGFTPVREVMRNGYLFIHMELLAPEPQQAQQDA